MKWSKATVISQKEWAPGLFSLYLQAPPILFKAGQFTQIAIDEEQGVFRPYSFVNAPEDPVLEFYYTLLSEGVQTPHLSQLKQGDNVWVQSKGAGRFTLDFAEKKDVLWLIATGTGLGPYLSILRTPLPWQRFEKIVLIHSVRYHNELTHSSLIQSWQQRLPQQFYWVPIVTRESIPGVFSSHIPSLIREETIEKSLNIKMLKSNQVMLCGNPHMIQEMKALLQLREFQIHHPPKVQGQIILETYWK